jgi:hypothetical protein
MILAFTKHGSPWAPLVHIVSEPTEEDSLF